MIFSSDVGYREPVVRTHDQLGFIGPERAYTGPAMNMPVPVNMFISPMAQPFHPQQQPMQMRKLSFFSVTAYSEPPVLRKCKIVCFYYNR